MSQNMARGEEASSANRREQSILPVLAEICEEEGRWVDIDPPTPEQDTREPNVIGNWVDENGRVGDEGEPYPIKAGFLMETVKNTTFEEDAGEDEKVLHKVYRTSKYNVHHRLKRTTLGEMVESRPESDVREIRRGIEAGELSPDEEVTIGQVFIREAEGYTKDD